LFHVLTKRVLRVNTTQYIHTWLQIQNIIHFLGRIFHETEYKNPSQCVMLLNKLIYECHNILQHIT
jgi:hypothetical protein